jgi:hypothetical protein
MQPACLGDQIVGGNAALRVWKSLRKEASFHATVIESEAAIAGRRIVGCGMGVFVKRAFADQELAEPRPGLNARIIASVNDGTSVALSRTEIAAGNAGKGVDFVTMYGTWREGVLSLDQLSEVQALLGSSFVEHYAGYRFHRVLKEAIGPSAIRLARATGTYRVVAEFSEAQSALVVLTRDGALAAPYSVAARLYRYQPPKLHLRPAEQELLAAAISAKTDAELSQELGLSIEATKKRWLSIFARVDQYLPEILNQTGAEGAGRGLQKRHRVLAYIRTHPEELRPFAWDSAKR